MRLVDFWDPPASKISMILSFYRKIKDQQKLSQMEEQSRVIKWLLKRGQLSFFFFIIQNKVLQLSQSIHYIIWVANDGSLSWIKNSLWLGLFKVAKPTFLILILINWCCNYYLNAYFKHHWLGKITEYWITVHTQYMLVTLLKLNACFVVVQLLSCVWLFVTPWTAACQSSLSFIIFRSLLKLMSLSQWWHDDIQPSHPLLPPSAPAFNLSQHQGLLRGKHTGLRGIQPRLYWLQTPCPWPKYQISKTQPLHP